MFYSFTITVPKNTPSSAKKETELNLSHGVITKVIFRPRPGHAALCHAQVFYRRHQIFPTNLDDDLHGDTFPVEWEEYFEMFEPPHILTVLSWNDDDTYAHTFDISFAILPRKAIIALAIVDAIKGLFRVFRAR